MIDAQLASAVRGRIGSPGLAERVVPRAADEDRYLELAGELSSVIRARFDLASPFEPRPADGAVVVGSQRPAPRMPSPGEIRRFAEAVIQQVQATVPRVGNLAAHPTVRKMLFDITTRVAQRAAARSVRVVLAGAGGEAR